MSLREYYHLTKPGIIRGNLLTATGGFLFAARGDIDVFLLAAVLLGMTLVIASACAFNNYLDRNIDANMERTKGRGLVSGAIPARNAIVFGAILGLAGLLILSVYVNVLTVSIGIVGFISYVFLYGFAKRKSVHGTLVGTISGSMPIVAGYVAVTNEVDLGAVLLFLILVFWQMAHFFGIAMYRHDDYAAANIPVLPVVKGMERTKVQVLYYILGFIIATLLLTLNGYSSITFAVVMALVGLYWLWLGLKDFRTTKENARWGKKMFLFSLIVILTLSVMLGLDSFLP